MHIAAKITLALGAVFLLIGVVATVSGAGSFNDASNLTYYELEDVTSGEILIEDEDGQGEWGLSFYIEAEYIDADDDGTWDFCDGLNITITPTEGGSQFDHEGACDSFLIEDEDAQFTPIAGHVFVGSACEGCTNGTVSFESNVPVWVVYEDKMMEEVWDDLGGGIVAFFGGIGSFCCSGIFILIGLILWAVLDDGSSVANSVYTVGSPMPGATPVAGVPVQQGIPALGGSQTQVVPSDVAVDQMQAAAGSPPASVVISDSPVIGADVDSISVASTPVMPQNTGAATITPPLGGEPQQGGFWEQNEQ